MPTKPEVLYKAQRLENGNETTTNVRSKNYYDLNDIMINRTRNAELRIPHCMFPAFNTCQTPLNDLTELQDFPSCTVSMPLPVHVAAKHCDRVDICHRRTLARDAYTHRLLHSRTRYLSALKSNKRYRAQEKKNIYNMFLYDVAERLERNPDPFFNSSYDYYYTNGNLCVLPEEHYLLHAGGSDLCDLNISRFTAKTNTVDGLTLRKLLRESVTQSSEIFEMMPFRTQRDDLKNCFAIRQRNSITLHAYNDDGRHKSLTQFNNEKTPFIGMAQSPVDINKLVLSSMKQHVRVYDINNSCTASLKSLHEMGKNNEPTWNTVKPWRENTYLYANSKELCLMDLRTKPDEWRKNSCDFSVNDFFCDSIVSLAHSACKKHFYVGTSHKLYCLDSRCWGRTFEDKSTVCCWYHQLEYPPLMMQTLRQNNSEFIALSSPHAGDLHFCELIRTGKVIDHSKKSKLVEAPLQIKSKYDYKAPSLPYLPTTLREGYESARLHGKCLRPHADLVRRLQCCTTGLAFYENTEISLSPLLLSANSNGDVFARVIGVRETQKHEPRTSAQTDEIMCKFEETICELTQPPLNYTEVVDMKAMRKVFRCSNLSHMKEEVESEEDGDVDDLDNVAALDNIVNVDAVSATADIPADVAEDAAATAAVNDKKQLKLPKRRRRLGGWQKSMHSLHSYKDILVSSLLSVWDIPYEEERDIKLSNLKSELRIKPEPEVLVSNWLNSNASVAPMTSIPMNVLNSSSRKKSSKKDHNTSLDQMFMDSFSEEFVDISCAIPQSTQLFEDAALDATWNTTAMNNTSMTNTITNVTKTSTTPMPPKKKKKSNYVKGF